MYEYITPQGYGDTFFQYVLDAQGRGYVDGQTYLQQGIQVNDGRFLVRAWNGLTTIADQLQIYDWLGRRFASSFMNIGAAYQSSSGWAQMMVLPEVEYPDGGNIRVDLGNVDQSVVGVESGLTIYRSQLVFSGVRRRQGVMGDPVPSSYQYYEKEFSLPYTLSIDNYASSGGVFLPPVQHKIQIQDYDFELRRVELSLGSDGQLAQFKIQLYDQYKVWVSNLPVLSNLFCHLNPKVQGGGEPFRSNGELNFWPSPPMLYKVNSVIQFDIYSLLVSPTALPQTFQLLFKGVRRIPCS